MEPLQLISEFTFTQRATVLEQYVTKLYELIFPIEHVEGCALNTWFLPITLH